jgi:uncharacterized lipoprotein YmbA
MRRRRLAIVLALGAVLTGCAVSDPSKYYALGTPSGPGEGRRPATGPGPTVGVGPIIIPGYLDRAQLVTRDDKGELEIWSYHRWAEALDLGIAATLVDALATRLGSDRIAVFPWRGVLARSLDYQVPVAVARFEGSGGKAVTLDARWRVLARDGKEVAFKRTTLTEPITESGFPGVVAAMNRSIVRLAADIGDAIQAQPANRAAVRD